IFIPFLAAIMVFLVCFNYIILSVARSLKRTKEIGLRKVLGATRGQVTFLFLSEAFVLALISLAGACLVLLWMAPAFNDLYIVQNAKMYINLDLMNNIEIYASFFLLTIVISLISGLYPSLYLSTFLPVKALKGVSFIKGFSRLLTRRILLVIQFSISIIIIITAIFLQKQTSFMMNYDKGLNVDNFASIINRSVDYTTLSNELKKSSLISDITCASNMPVHGSWGRTRITPFNSDEEMELAYYSIDPDFIPFFGLDIVAGRNFSYDLQSDIETGVILNEKAVHLLGYESPADVIGKPVFRGSEKNYIAIGVLKDFHFKSLENELEPLMIRYTPEHFDYVHIRFTQGQKEELKAAIAEIWKELDPVRIVDLQFYDELEAEEQTLFSELITLSGWISGFIIFVSLIGMFGMTLYTVEMKEKEIGIRKVLGAGVSKLVLYLSKDIFKIILYSGIVGLPCAWLINKMFLQEFAHRISLSPWVFTLGVLIPLTLSLLICGSQTLRAALINPIEILKDE
ncbi:FtsX-like permease family protein, partial [candidate division KSB1 bacterium]